MLHPLFQLGTGSARRYVRQIRYCYERELVINPTLGGKLALVFTIDERGKTSNVSANGLGPKMSKCLKATVLRIRFPSRKKSVRVTYPFMFEPAN